MADVKVGDVLECAIWLTGTESEEHVKRWQDVDCPNSLNKAASDKDVLVGPIVFSIKRPGEDRVPQVPDHVSGSDVRLMVAEATVIALRSLDGNGSSFLLDLEPKDLALLRKVTRRVWAKANNGGLLTDDECDRVINEIGPEAAMRAVREATVH